MFGSWHRSTSSRLPPERGGVVVAILVLLAIALAAAAGIRRVGRDVSSKLRKQGCSAAAVGVEGSRAPCESTAGTRAPPARLLPVASSSAPRLLGEEAGATAVHMGLRASDPGDVAGPPAGRPGAGSPWLELSQTARDFVSRLSGQRIPGLADKVIGATVRVGDYSGTLVSYGGRRYLVGYLPGFEVGEVGRFSNGVDARAVAYDPDFKLTVLAVPDGAFEELHALPMTSSTTVTTGELTYLGNRATEQKVQVRRGTITDQQTRLQIAAEISGPALGGPVVDPDTGELIGVLTGEKSDANFDAIIFAAPPAALHRLLRRAAGRELPARQPAGGGEEDGLSPANRGAVSEALGAELRELASEAVDATASTTDGGAIRGTVITTDGTNRLLISVSRDGEAANQSESVKIGGEARDTVLLHRDPLTGLEVREFTDDASDLPALPLSPEVSVGDTIVAASGLPVSYSRDLSATGDVTVTRGAVVARATAIDAARFNISIPPERLLNDDLKILEIDAPVWHGHHNWGAPVVDTDGRLAGLMLHDSEWVKSTAYVLSADSIRGVLSTYAPSASSPPGTRSSERRIEPLLNRLGGWLARDAEASVVRLKFEGQERGTGFVLNHGGRKLLVSAEHVVRVAPDRVLEMVAGDGSRHVVRFEFANRGLDLAVGELPQGVDLPGLELAHGSAPQAPLNPVVFIGNGGGERVSAEVGAVAGYKNPADLLGHRMVVAGFLNPGDSGGPILNLAGQVNGVMLAKHQAPDEGFGLALPAHLLRQFLDVMY